MMKTIVALVLASSASAFKPSKAFLGFGGLASASKYDPKIFEDASAAKDAFPIEQGERRLQLNVDLPDIQSIIANCKDECAKCNVFLSPELFTKASKFGTKPSMSRGGLLRRARTTG